MKEVKSKLVADSNDSAILNAKEIKRNRLNSLANVFSRALSVLTQRIISVSVVEQKTQSSPAWSSTTNVYLNEPMIKDDFSARAISSLNGLNFHELGHLRYTPRRGSKLIQLITNSNDSQQLWESFNCLEDSRIENLLVGYLPSIKSWLLATITDYLLSDEAEKLFDRSFPLVYGRYYLPQELRQRSADSYANQNDLNELKSIIDEYTQIIFNGDEVAERAFELISRFNELLGNLTPTCVYPKPNGDSDDSDSPNGTGQITIRIPNSNGHHTRPTQGYESSHIRPALTKDQMRDLANAIKNKKVDIEINLDKDRVRKSSQPINTKEIPSKIEISFGDSSGDISDLDLDIDLPNFDSDSPSGNSPSQNNGSNSNKGNSKTQGKGSSNELNNLLEGLLDDVVKDLSKELNQIAKQIGVASLETADIELMKANFKEVDLSSDMVLVSRSFTRELERLRAEFDPMWQRKTASGKLIPHRFVRGDDIETIFDEFTFGRDDITAIEAVILLDKSGSMEGENATHAYNSMWAIKSSLDKLEANTSVVVFDYHAKILYDSNEKATTKVRNAGASGGTHPHEGLLYAKMKFAETDKPIRILFMITDGAWDSDESETIIKELRNAGVLTAQALIDSSVAKRVNSIDSNSVVRNYVEQYRHSFELMTIISSAKEIISLAKELVRLGIKRNLVA